MKYLIKKFVQQELTEVEWVQCDWCKKAFDDENKETYKDSGIQVDYNDVSVDSKFLYEVSESSNPDWISTKGFEVEDLCPTCAMKLKELMIDAGIKVTEIYRW